MTRAIVLAAGQGTRLRPLTNNKPKCLVPLLGISLLDRQTTVLKQCGITDIHIAAGYRADQIQALGYSVTVHERFAQTNMVETLFSAREFLEKDGELIISYGDIVYQKENLEKVLASDAQITLMIDKEWRRYWALRLENPLEDAETLVMDDEGYVVELGKKPESYERIQGQYTGLIKIRADKVTDLMQFYDTLDRSAHYDGKDFHNMYMTSFLQLLIDAGWKVKAAIVENGWLEVDSVDDLQLYEKLAKQGELQKFYQVD
jgi:choline kinase